MDCTSITISEKEYDKLKKAQAELAALYAAGVNSWDGYDWAMEELNDG